jgi:filamentous hemagglutinin family protein
MQRKIRRQIERRLRQKVKQALWTSVAAAGLLLGACGYCLANPTGGTVTGGTANISGEGTAAVTVTQTTDKAAINWNSFGIGSGESVTFVQPGTNSIALNRVTGTDASAIYGTLSSNGKVYLINPNGILFSRTAQVNVGGIVASTLNISDSNFLSGNYSFSGNSGSVVNNGTISASDGGYIVFLGNTVGNHGTMTAGSGTVALGAGSKITLDFAGDGLLGLTVDKAALGSLATNSGTITADGGAVYLSAAAADTLAGTVVNNSGTILAQSVAEVNGKIILSGGNNGTVTNSGTLDASGTDRGETGGTVKVLGNTVNLADGTLVNVSGAAGGGTALIGGNYQGGGSEQHAMATTVAAGATLNADAIAAGDGGRVVVWSDQDTNFAGVITARGGSVSGNGGKVETSSKGSLHVANTASVTTTAANGVTGSWLLDPENFTIGSGTGYDLDVATLKAALANSNVTITTGANSNTVTSTDLNSNTDTTSGTEAGDITLDAALDWDSDYDLTLSAYHDLNINGTITASGANAGLSLTAGNNINVNKAISLTGASASLAMDYGDSGAYSLADGVAITLSGASAGLTIEGNTYTVINKQTAAAIFTNFATSTDATLLTKCYAFGENFDVANIASWVPGITSWTPIGTSSSPFSGVCDGLGHTVSNFSLSSTSNNIGLFGYSSGTIRNLGLIDPTVIGTIDPATKSGGSYVGGLIGYSTGTIDNCYVTVTTGSTTTVSGTANVGGLVGYTTGKITDCHSDVDVTATQDGDQNSNVGGLVGKAKGSSLITGCYSTGNVTGTGNYVGGLTGYSQWFTIANCYATGDVGGSNYVGGLVGYINKSGSISGSHSTGSVTGAGWVGGLIGYNIATLTGCYATGAVESNGGCVGGLIGYNTGTLGSSSDTDKCYSTGTVTANGTTSLTINKTTVTGAFAGGLIGYNTGSITNVSVDKDSTVTSSGSYVGGLIGYNTAALTGINSSNDVTVTSISGNYVGGFIGYNTGTLTSCSATGAVTSSGSYVGGLCGINGGTITSCFTSGTVEADGNYVGGLIGSNSSTLTGCYATGAVTSSGSYVGGLIGQNSGALTGCYATTGAVTAKGTTSLTVSGTVYSGAFVGGLCGYNSAKLSDCYSGSNVAMNGTSTGNYYTGGLVGYNTGQIWNCYTANNTVVESNGSYVGGLCGFNSASVYGQCEYITVKATGSDSKYVGGFVGENTGSVCGGWCDNNTVISSGSYVGGLVGWNTGNGTVNQSSYVGNCSVTATGDYVGGLIGNNDSKASVSVQWSNVESTKVTSDGSDVGGFIGNNTGVISKGNYDTIYSRCNSVTAKGNHVGGFVGYNTGNINGCESYCNVTSTSTAAETDVGGFIGYNSGTISNCRSTGDYSNSTSESSSYYGLVKSTGGYVGGFIGNNYGGTITNDHSDACLVKSSGSRVGGLIGSNTNTGAVSDSYSLNNTVSSTSTAAETDVGGLIGYNTGTITNSGRKSTTTVGAVTSKGGYVGGVIGYNEGTIKSCYNTSSGAYGEVTANGSYAGGLIGYNTGAVSGSYSTMLYDDVTAKGSYAGGLIGYNTGALTNCYATGGTYNEVEASNGYAGGLIGYNTGKLISCYATTGRVMSYGAYVGGLAGYNTADIEKSYATSPVESDYGVKVSAGGVNTGITYAYTGGLVGYNKSGNITSSYSTGTVIGTVTSIKGQETGGLVGCLEAGTVSQCYHATGSVTGSGADVGGLVGSVGSGAVVENCFNTGAVKGLAQVGGLVGNNSGTLRYSYNTGTVAASGSGNSDFGGLVGANNSGGAISCCYNAGSLAGVGSNTVIGGVAGLNNGTITSCYWSTDNNTAISVGVGSGTAIDDAVYGLTTTQMKDADNFADWVTTADPTKSDIDTVGGAALTWRLYEGCTTPLLKCFLTTTLTVSADDASKTYDGAVGTPGNVTYTTGNSSTVQSSQLLGTLSFGSDPDVGTYTLTGLYSTQLGYDLIYGGGTLKINPLPITVTVNNQSRTYGDANPTTGTVTITDGSLVGTDTINTDVNVNSTATVTSDVGSYGLSTDSVTFSSGKTFNYAITYADGTLGITARPIIVTVGNQSRTYGNANPTSGTVALTGGSLVNSDAIESGVSVSTIATVSSDVGSYGLSTDSVTFSSGKASNYAITYADGTLGITARPITVTVGNQSRTYGDANPTAGTVTVTDGSLVNGDTLGTASVSSNATVGSDVGNYALSSDSVSFSNGKASNYAITYNDGTLAVTARPITVTADNQSRIYGNANPTGGTVTLTDGSLVNGDTLGIASVSSNATAGSDVGNYILSSDSVNFSNGKASNYAITYNDGTLAVTARPITISVGDQSRIYGETNPTNGTIAVTAGNLANGDTFGTVAVSSNATVGSDVGNYTLSTDKDSITFSKGQASNYAITYDEGTLKVTARPITVTVNDQSRTYGDANPTAGTVTVTDGSLVNGDTLGTANVSSNAMVGSDVGNYALSSDSVSFSNGKASNYAITYNDGTLAVTARPITVTADNQTRIYGNANPTGGTVTLTGGSLVNGDTLGTASVSSNATVGSDVGNYTLSSDSVNFSNGKASNYAITYNDGTLAVTARPITISVGDQSRIYGNANPTTGTIAVTEGGLVNGDTFGTVAVSSNATAGSDVGNYMLSTDKDSITFSKGQASNYAITYDEGTLKVTARPITVMVNDQSRIYGNANPTAGTVTVTDGSLVNGDMITSAVTVSSTAGATSDVGSYALSTDGVTFSNGKASNYAVTYDEGTLNVTARPITVTVDNQSRIYGNANPTTGTATLTGGSLVNGDTLGTASVSSNAAAGSDVGNYTLSSDSVNFSNGKASNYAITYNDGTLAVTARPITISVGDQSRIYGEANPTTGTIAVTEGNLVNGDTFGTVAVSSNATAGSDIGNYTLSTDKDSITFSKGQASNYAITYDEGTLKVTARPITVMVNDQSRIYGNANPTAGTVTVTDGSLVNGDTINSAVTVSSTADATSDVGSYALSTDGVTFSNGKASNYAVTYDEGMLNVTARPITVTVDNQSRIYGNANPTGGTVTLTGGSLVNGDTLGIARVSSNATANSNVGSYALNADSITFSNGNASNYAISYVGGTLDITRAALTVTANNATWIIGAGQPDYGVTCTGLVKGDTAAVLGTLAYTTTCADPAVAGQYEIKVSGPVATTNYVVSYVNGVLTVTAPVVAPVDAKYSGALATLLGTKDEPSFMEMGDFQLNILGRGVNIDDNDFLKFLSSNDTGRTY